MGFLKTIVFYLGIAAGLATLGGIGAVLLTYLFTGKVPTVTQLEDEKMQMKLLTPDEVVALMREQAHKAESAIESHVETGG